MIEQTSQNYADQIKDKDSIMILTMILIDLTHRY